MLRREPCLLRGSSTSASGLPEHRHLARYGGEEFAVILPASPSSAAAVTGERLRRAVAEAPTVVPITASVGIATFPDHVSGAGGLLRAADTALYESKQRGRDQVTIFGGHDRPVAASADNLHHP
jgi:diguanylate cyclase (GGDEF)-like protein